MSTIGRRYAHLTPHFAESTVGDLAAVYGDAAYGTSMPPDASGFPPTELPLSAPTDSGASYYREYLDAYAPTLSRLLFGADPREEMAILAAKIENYRQLAAATNIGPLRNFYVLELNKMQQRYNSLVTQASERQAYADSVRAAQLLGLGVLVLGGAALTAIAARQVSAIQLEREKRENLRQARVKRFAPTDE
jgi:hypothetical protein